MTKDQLRNIGSNITAYLLGVTLLVTSSFAIFHFVLADSGQVKNIISDSGSYGSFVDSFLDSVGKNESPAESDIPINNPAIKKGINRAFSPEILQNNTEELIDGTYAWLHGNTDNPRFTLDFTKSKAILASEAGDYAQKRATKLSSCSFQDIPQKIDPFNAKCLPPGVTPKQIGDKVARDIKSDKGFLQNPKITPENIFGKNSDTNIFKQTDLPSQFQTAYNMLWLFVLLIVVLAVSTVFLHVNRMKGASKASKSFVVVGIFSILTPLSLSFFSSKISDSDMLGNSSVTEKVIIPITQELVGAVSLVYYIFGGICLLIGTSSLIYIYKSKPTSGSREDIK